LSARTASNNAYSWTAHYNEDLLSTLNGLNQLTQVGAAAIAHDARGNLTGDGVNAFTYDPQNRLRTATRAGVTATLSYDPLGRLFETARPGSTTTWFVYDGGQLLAEYSNTGSMLRRYVPGGSFCAFSSANRSPLSRKTRGGPTKRSSGMKAGR
jgi:YD repeat-containing protein